MKKKSKYKKKKIFFKNLKQKPYKYFNNDSKKNLNKKLIINLYRNKKLKKGIFFKPSLKQIYYPFSLNFKLINEFLKKK